jgi:glycosyltransferase involved in cell wall biosynthesis
VVGFPVGGVSEMIQDGENGILCETVSVNSLVNGIERALESSHIFDTTKISGAAAERYSMAGQAQAYHNLYKEILG